MPPPASAFIRTPAFWAATIGLSLAYLAAALIFARSGHVVDFGWPGRFYFGPSLLLGVPVLYGGAWLFGRRAAGQRPSRAGWWGAAGGVLTLLATIVLVGGYNAAEEALRFMPFPGTTAADFYRHLGHACYDYIVKPLAWVMPLGCLVAGPLGWWAGRRPAGPTP